MSAQNQTTHTFSSTPAGTTMGLKESECGQMGVIRMAGTLGWIMDAPAATAYAVLPVGVETMTPGGAQTHIAHTVNEGTTSHPSDKYAMTLLP